jgi:hypothetical protein
MNTYNPTIIVRNTLKQVAMLHTFSQYVGDQPSIRTAGNWLSEGKIPKAILVKGDAGSGTSTFARMFANAAACLDRPRQHMDPCGTCRCCIGESIFTIYEPVASEVNTDQFIERVHSIRNGNSGNLFQDHGNCLPIVVDGIDSLSDETQRRLLVELKHKWVDSFLITTTHQPHRLYKPLRDRFLEVRMNRPMPYQTVEWSKSLCIKAGIKVESPDSLYDLVDQCAGNFSLIVDRLQAISDLGLDVCGFSIGLAAAMRRAAA